MRLRPAFFGVLLVGTGFVVRLALVLALRDVHAMPAGGVSADDVEYNVLALHVAEGEGFSNHTGRLTSFRAPGWPLFMAGVYRTCGSRPEAIYIVSCLLGGLTCLLAYLIGRRLLDERAARIAGTLCVFYLPQVYCAVLFWSENLFIPLFAAAVWVLLLFLPSSHWREGSGVRGHTLGLGSLTLACASGLLLGAAALTRPFALLAVPLFALVLLVAWRQVWMRALAAGAVMGLGVLMVVAPWTYRNLQVHQRPVLVATNGGSTFYGGNNDRVVREWRLWGSWVSTTDLPHRDLIDAAANEVAHDAVEWQLGRQWVAEHPGHALLTVPLKLARLVLWLPDFDAGRWYYLARAAGFLPFLALMFLGAWRGLRMGWINSPGWWLLHAAILATAITAIVFWGSPRFRDANAPLLMVYAGLAFARRTPTVATGCQPVATMSDGDRLAACRYEKEAVGASSR
jgi:4-amino-4-deoxy-L-arabinose transferase-like glycosyltransferase